MKAGNIEDKKKNIGVDKSLEKYVGKTTSPKKAKAFNEALPQIKEALAKFTKSPVH